MTIFRCCRYFHWSIQCHKCTTFQTRNNEVTWRFYRCGSLAKYILTPLALTYSCVNEFQCKRVPRRKGFINCTGCVTSWRLSVIRSRILIRWIIRCTAKTIMYVSHKIVWLLCHNSHAWMVCVPDTYALCTICFVCWQRVSVSDVNMVFNNNNNNNIEV